MFKMGIITRYMLREISLSYLGGFLFISSIFFVTQIFLTVRSIVENNAPVFKALKSLFLFMPMIGEFTISLAVVMGSMLAIGRLSDDLEITAMRSCGVSLFKVFSPCIGFGVFILMFSLLFYQFILPEATRNYVESRTELAEINPAGELSSNLSMQTPNGYIINVDSVSENFLFNIRIKSIQDRQIIFAPIGKLLGKDLRKNAYPLILWHSSVQPTNTNRGKLKKQGFKNYTSLRQVLYIPDKDIWERAIGHRGWSLTEFYNELKEDDLQNLSNLLYDYHYLQWLEFEYRERDLELKQISPIQDKTLAIYPYSTEWLNAKIARKKIEGRIESAKISIDYKIENKGGLYFQQQRFIFQRKLAFCVVSLGFSIIGSALGIFSKRSGKSMGFGLSILIIALFLGIMLLGDITIQKRIFSPFTAAWLPVITVYVLGSYFLYIRLIQRNGIFDIIQKWYKFKVKWMFKRIFHLFFSSK